MSAAADCAACGWMPAMQGRPVCFDCADDDEAIKPYNYGIVDHDGSVEHHYHDPDPAGNIRRKLADLEDRWLNGPPIIREPPRRDRRGRILPPDPPSWGDRDQVERELNRRASMSIDFGRRGGPDMIIFDDVEEPEDDDVEEPEDDTEPPPNAWGAVSARLLGNWGTCPDHGRTEIGRPRGDGIWRCLKAVSVDVVEGVTKRYVICGRHATPERNDDA